MFYCQHVLGIGHFFRSMAVARALAGHEVLFVEGGEPLEGYEPPAHVNRLFLPPLRMDPEFDHLETHQADLDTVKSERKRTLLEAFETFSPRVLLTELFPFGRNQFRFELIPLLEAIRAGERPTRVLCSLRDILVEKEDPDAYEERVLTRLNAYYDGVLVHSDPRIFSLHETFTRLGSIVTPVHYTGYVVRETSTEGPIPPEATRATPFRTILVSAGGGRVGVDLLAACIEALRHLPDPDLRMILFLGPFIELVDRSMLGDLASKDPRTALRPFAPDFATELRRATLSISMAGYNTCMDLVTTGTRALVYPFPQNREQSMRAAKLEALGLVRTLRGLDPRDLSEAIAQALSSPPRQAPPAIDLDGARATARLVEAYGRTVSG